MTFVGPNDILVTEKNTGIVKRITNGQLNPEPVLDESIANVKERGMLGIAAAVNSNRNGNGNASTNTIGPTYVFLYYTDSSSTTDGADADSEENVLGSRLYRYELIDNQLVNPKLLLDLPAHPPPEREEASRDHYGGKVLIEPADNYVYVGIGNVVVHKGQAQNYVDGEPLDGTSGILRVGQDGEVQPNPPLGSTQTMSPYYYAYGIRNTFGMDFDPITGKLWDTENGLMDNDEINLVEPGFNSGWRQVMGIASVDNKLGSQYQNTMFIGDTNLGWLYNFKLNPQRTGLMFSDNSTLADKIANTPEEIQETIFGKGFGVITDIQVSPYDGNLYVLTFAGSIYKIYSSL